MVLMGFLGRLQPGAHQQQHQLALVCRPETVPSGVYPQQAARWAIPQGLVRGMYMVRWGL